MQSVTNLSECRDLLSAWEDVRRQILKGNIKGWALCLAQWDDTEKVSFAGAYLHSGEDAASAALRLSWEITSQGDPTGTTGP